MVVRDAHEAVNGALRSVSHWGVQGNFRDEKRGCHPRLDLVDTVVGLVRRHTWSVLRPALVAEVGEKVRCKCYALSAR